MRPGVFVRLFYAPGKYSTGLYEKMVYFDDSSLQKC